MRGHGRSCQKFARHQRERKRGLNGAEPQITLLSGGNATPRTGLAARHGSRPATPRVESLLRIVQSRTSKVDKKEKQL